MNRRSFLKSIAGVAGTTALAPVAALAISEPVVPMVYSVFSGRYYMGIDTAFGQDKTVVAYYIADSSAAGPVPMYIWKNPS